MLFLHMSVLAAACISDLILSGLLSGLMSGLVSGGGTDADRFGGPRGRTGRLAAARAGRPAVLRSQRGLRLARARLQGPGSRYGLIN
jgi:hypothetical protein